MTRSSVAHPKTQIDISAGARRVARLVAIAGLSLGVFAAGACSGDVVGGTRVPDEEDCEFGCEVSQDDDSSVQQGSGSGTGGDDAAATTSGVATTAASTSSASGGGEGGGGGAGDGGAGGAGGGS